MLERLLRAAANYDDIDRVMSSLEKLVDDWVIAYQKMADSSEYIQGAVTWKNRAAATSGMINQMLSRLIDIKPESANFPNNDAVL